MVGSDDDSELPEMAKTNVLKYSETQTDFAVLVSLTQCFNEISYLRVGG